MARGILPGRRGVKAEYRIQESGVRRDKAENHFF
jgi:hypothetical protein